MTALSLAMAHNRIPVVSRIEIQNLGAEVVPGAVVKVAVRDSEGALSHPWERLVDLAAGSSTMLDSVGLTLDPAQMLQVEERRPGQVVVTVEIDGATAGRTSSEVEVLSGHQWLAKPHGLAMEMLAAHVMPNSPEIADLLSEAADLLSARTGSPSIEGYQAGAERVDLIARAIFEAMQARQIRYSTPPASWSDTGQKVRTPHEVLVGRVGTCLDTVVVMAAALEQAGIRPLLWIVEGHAFLGYWREKGALDAITQSDVSDVVNFIDLGLIRLIETTMVTAGEDPASFDETHKPPYVEYLTGDLHKVYGVVDVWTARQNQILPLPAHVRTSAGVQIVEYRAAEHSTPRPAPSGVSASDASATRPQKPVPPRIQQWKNALLDLSLRNKLINFSERNAPFLPWPMQLLGTRDVLDNIQSPRSAHRVQEALVDVVDSEGPVHVERLAKLVAAAFGLNRVAASRSSAILGQLPRGMRTGDFAWPAARRPDEWKGFRRDPDAIRRVEHVSLGELGNAMVALAAANGLHRAP